MIGKRLDRGGYQFDHGPLRIVAGLWQLLGRVRGRKESKGRRQTKVYRAFFDELSTFGPRHPRSRGHQ